MVMCEQRGRRGVHCVTAGRHRHSRRLRSIISIAAVVGVGSDNKAVTVATAHPCAVQSALLVLPPLKDAM